MKRKIFIILLSLIAAVGCLFAFTACGDGKDGANGTDGKDGVGIVKVEYNDDGELVIYYTDGSSKNIGKAPECEHEFSGYSVGFAATCTATGYRTRSCSVCGYTEYDFIRPLGHRYGEGVETIAPTCTQRGFKTATCADCGDVKVETIVPLEHDNQTVSAQAPDCTHTGWDSYEVCSRCDYSTYEEIPATGHTPSFNSGGTEPLVCRDCGTAIVGVALDGYLSSFNSTYGYEWLGTLGNGGLQQLYSAIDAEVKKFHVSREDAEDNIAFEIDYSPYNLTMDEAVKVWKTYRDDNPLYYWMTGTLTYTVKSIKIDVEDEYCSGEARAAQTALLDAKISELKDKYSGESSAYMLALAYHDEIINSIDYAYSTGNVPEEANWAHSISGVLDGRGAVCEGYAKTFQLLLNVSGVNNIFVTGKSRNQNHAWNLVEVEDGKWYWYDLTWDDTPDYYWGIQYNYLCATDEDFLKNHTVSPSNGALADFLYDLPDRATEQYGGCLNSEFISNYRFKWRVSGYNKVSLIESYNDCEVIIPKTVLNGGRIYTVVAIGADEKSPFNNIAKDGATSPDIYYVPTSVSIPETVIFIGEGSFNGVRSLERITVDEANPVFSSVDGVLYTKSLYTLIVYPCAKSDVSYAIPDQTAQIAAYALRSFQYLEAITIGKSVQGTGILNWYGIKYPDSDADMLSGSIISKYNYLAGEWGMIVWSLKGDKRVTVHEQNRYYLVDDDMLFNGTKTVILAPLGNREHYDIPEGVEQISGSAFWNNLTLRSVSLPDSLELIGNGAFSNCFNLESIHIPANVRYLKNAFGSCSNLKEITVDGENEYYTALGGILYNKELTEIIHVPEETEGNVILPNGITRIEDFTFTGCGNVKSIFIPSGVTYIGSYALWYCDSLEAINFGGTKAQWTAIEKGKEWNTYTGDYTVYCTDGSIIKG